MSYIYTRTGIMDPVSFVQTYIRRHQDVQWPAAPPPITAVQVQKNQVNRLNQMYHRIRIGDTMWYIDREANRLVEFRVAAKCVTDGVYQVMDGDGIVYPVEWSRRQKDAARIRLEQFGGKK